MRSMLFFSIASVVNMSSLYIAIMSVSKKGFGFKVLHLFLFMISSLMYDFSERYAIVMFLMISESVSPIMPFNFSSTFHCPLENVTWIFLVIRFPPNSPENLSRLLQSNILFYNYSLNSSVHFRVKKLFIKKQLCFLD